MYTVPYENSAKIEVEHIPDTGDIHYEIDIKNTPVDIFFAFTNVNEVVGSDSPNVVAESIVVNGKEFPAPAPTNFAYSAGEKDAIHDYIDTSTRELLKSINRSTANRNIISLPGVPSFDGVNDSGSFSIFVGDSALSVSATCRGVVGPISTAQGNRTLNIWVADDCWWETGNSKRHYITPEMVTAIEGNFLKSGLDNDIYDWVTNILGPEWGNTGYSNLIPPNNEITILLGDINNDNSDSGGTVGYFWGGNNYTSSDVPESNERIMFVVDAVMYANPSEDGSSTSVNSGWTETAYWPKIVFSTLAHEFQHMIHFYQKNFIADASNSTETWINEMCSMLIEDFLADKIGVEGPRGVSPLIGTAGSPGNTEGRLPWFNQYLFRPLIVDYPQPFTVEDYPVAYAFGAWLARNYGGVEFLHDVVCSPYFDKKAIEYAVQKHTGGTESFERLLQRWGGAIFLSDQTEAPSKYQYNSGEWFTSAINGNEYNLGSINLYNYSPAPEIATSVSQLSSGLTAPGTNVYLLAKENASGKLAWDITIPEDVRLTVIYKGR